MRITRFIFPACLLIFCSCAATSNRWYADDSSRPPLPTETSFNKGAGRGDQLFITLRSGGSEDWLFMVDTGAYDTVLDKSLEPKLGKRIETKHVLYGWLGKRTVGIYESPKLYLGNIQLRTGDHVWTDDLSQQVEPGHRAMGILGMDCLHHYCIQLDFAAKKLRFLSPGLSTNEDFGNAFPLTISRANLTTHGAFMDAKDSDLGVDTAHYDDGAMDTKKFQRVLNEQNDVYIRQWKNKNGITREAHFEKGVFNGDTFSDLILMECPSGENFIGLRLLARHLVTFDFPKQTMYLKRINDKSSSNKN